MEGLASVYCEMLMAPFGEVLLALEDARQKAWLDRSPKHSSGMNKGHRGSCNQIDTLPNSHSQPIYVPGKYLVRIEIMFAFLVSFVPIMSSPYSHQVVSPIKKRTRFMVSATGCSPRGSGGASCSPFKGKCHNRIHYQIVQPMYL